MSSSQATQPRASYGRYESNTTYLTNGPFRQPDELDDAPCFRVGIYGATLLYLREPCDFSRINTEP